MQVAKFTEKLNKLSSGDLAGAAAMSTRKLSKEENKEEEEGLEPDLGDGIGGTADGTADMDWSPDSPRLDAVDPARRMWRARSAHLSSPEAH